MLKDRLTKMNTRKMPLLDALSMGEADADTIFQNLEEDEADMKP